MRNIAVFTAGVIAVSSLLLAQQAQPTTTVPRLVRVSNTFLPADGGKPAPVEGVTFSIYRAASEGAPLWQEIQNVSVDSEGRYNVRLGTTMGCRWICSPPASPAGWECGSTARGK
jgi:hypothetical protein